MAMVSEFSPRCEIIAYIIVISVCVGPLVWQAIQKPQCYINQIYVPALNKTLSSATNNNTIFFTLYFPNFNILKSYTYQDIVLTLSVFETRNATRPLGNATVPSFDLGIIQHSHKHGSLTALASNLTTPVNGKVVYRVDLHLVYQTWAVRCRLSCGVSNRLWGGANVEIGDSGLMLSRKSIKLDHSPPIIAT